MFTLTVREVNLSDSSKVYNLEFSTHTLDCVTLDDAFALAETFQAAILSRTNEDCRILSR